MKMRNKLYSALKSVREVKALFNTFQSFITSLKIWIYKYRLKVDLVMSQNLKCQFNTKYTPNSIPGVIDKSRTSKPQVTYDAVPYTI